MVSTRKQWNVISLAAFVFLALGCGQNAVSPSTVGDTSVDTLRPDAQAVQGRATKSTIPHQYAASLTPSQQLIEAAFHGDLVTAKARLEDGVDIDARYSGSPSAFRGDDGGTPIAAGEWTALHAAASALQAEVVEILIEAGANLDLDDGHGATALAMCVDVYDRQHQKDDCALLLIKAGAKVNTKTGIYIDGIGGHTPLHRAVCWNQKRAVFALIEAGADVNAKDDGGGTPLHDAFLCKADQVIVDALLRAGADQNERDNSGRRPSYWK